MTDLDGKIAVITGAKGGLGNFTTNAFLTAGANVAGVSRSIAQADFPHARFTAFPAELAGGPSAGALVAKIIERFRKIDILVDLIGGFAGGKPVSETDDATLERMLDLNLRSAFYMARAVLPVMRASGTGRIVAIGSRAAVEPQPGIAAYSASKAALVSLVRTIAMENQDRGITANVILPGTMDTPANRAADPSADFSKWVDPGRVADLAVWLSSDAASEVSGAVIPVYGENL